MDKDLIIKELRQENRRLQEENAYLRSRIQELEARIKHLEEIINKDSRNSSKPPSTDGFKRTNNRSLRERTGRKPGGQQGHKGTTLRMVDIPDKEVFHKVDRCIGCGKDISWAGTKKYERRQVFDLPELKLEVKEHKAEVKVCPLCHTENKAAFPKEVSKPVQYGERIKSLELYMMSYQLLPFERTKEFLEDIFKHRVSEGTFQNTHQRCYQLLEEYEQKVKDSLLSSDTVHFDETGFYMEGNREWLHSASTQDVTYYYVHQNRSKEAMDAMDILPHYKGRAIHDFWQSYLGYKCSHGLCNVHHLRDLTFCHEQEKSEWGGEMKNLLKKIKQKVDHAKLMGRDSLTESQIRYYYRKYLHLLDIGRKEHPPPQQVKGKRGRIKKSKSRNLLERFDKYRNEILQFMYDFNVPFDNNLAERDIRMMKLKQKISGCFRSRKGAEYFARIRGYISTMRKQGLAVMDALERAVIGNPILPYCMTS